MRASPKASATEGRTSTSLACSAWGSCSCGRQPAMPETAPLLAAEWGGLKVLEVDTARKTMQPPPRQAQQGCDFGFGAGRHDQPLAAARPAAKPVLPVACIPPVRGRRPAGECAQEGEFGAVQLPDDW